MQCWSKTSFLGRCGVPKVSKSDGVLVKDVLSSRLGVPKAAKSCGGLLQNKLLGTLRRIPRIPRKRRSHLQLGPPVPHAPGARMT